MRMMNPTTFFQGLLCLSNLLLLVVGKIRCYSKASTILLGTLLTHHLFGILKLNYFPPQFKAF